MAGQKKQKIVGDRRWIRYLTVILSLLGLVISAYAYYVEMQLESNHKYKPWCDFNDKVRCSKTLSSPYGRGFGFLGKVFGDKHTLTQPNTLYGMVFYALMACLGFARNSKASLVQLNLAFISVLVSGYLAYVLLFQLKEICPVCIATYVVNVLLLLLSIFKGKPRIAGPQDGKGPKTSNGRAAKDAGKPSPVPSPVSNPNRPSYAQAVKQDTKKRA